MLETGVRESRLFWRYLGLTRILCKCESSSICLMLDGPRGVSRSLTSRWLPQAPSPVGSHKLSPLRPRLSGQEGGLP